MTSYTKTTDFEVKDTLLTGNPSKVIKGQEIDDEFDAVQAADADNLKISGLATGVNTFLTTPSSANLAAAVTDETGSGALVFATSPTLVTPALGTPASGTLDNCTTNTEAAGTNNTQLANTAHVFAERTNAATLTNKTINLASNTVTGTTAQFNTALSDGDFATLAGSETLTNKTLTTPIINTGDINAPDIDGGTIDGATIGGATPAAGTFTTATATSANLQANNTGITTGDPLNTLRFTDTDTTSATDQPFGAIEFYSTDASNDGVKAFIRAAAESATVPSYLSFGTATAATDAVEKMRIDSSGNVIVTGAGGLGYGTGSGGTVTQAASRTTGVTINKTNGAITLVSAAGSTSWQSFTVTNSTVAATDTIIVSQKSGTDLNMIEVTAVAAGSFRISFATTGGTTVEQPVFNFAVIKAVTA